MNIKAGSLLLAIGMIGAVLAVASPAIAAQPTGFSNPGDERIGAGFRHTCVVADDGHVWCWGSNSDGQLGDGTTISSAVPVAVTGISNATAVAGGTSSSCALLSDTTVRCWGSNGYGQLGDGTNVSSLTPVAVTGLTGVVALDLQTTACALLADGTVRCWGANFTGSLGDGTTVESRSSPAPVSGLTDVTEVRLGGSGGCAVQGTGDVWCWGWNGQAQITIDSLPETVSSPINTGVEAASSLAHGSNFVCAATTVDLETMCWGSNYLSQLPGAVGSSTVEEPTIAEIAPTSRLVAGFAFACAIHGAENAVSCWGVNDQGQLGEGTLSVGRFTPGPVSAPAPAATAPFIGVDAMGAGESHACAVADGSVYCWGDNEYGQIGDGGYAAASRPVEVFELDEPGPVNNPLCAGLAPTHAGTDGDDIIYGTNDADIIATYGGNDRVYGLGGDDTICLGSGDDRAFAGAGADLVFGGDGIDKIRGGPGQNTIHGGPGTVDFLKGGPESDEIYGGIGHDRIRGSGGDDVLSGGDDIDWMWGGSGDDYLNGDGHGDVMSGGEGTDHCHGGSGGGIDTASPTCETIAAIP